MTIRLIKRKKIKADKMFTNFYLIFPNDVWVSIKPSFKSDFSTLNLLADKDVNNEQ